MLSSVTRVLSVLAKPQVNTWAMDTMAQHILDNYYPGMSTEEMILLLQEARTKPEGESQKAADTGSEVHPKGGVGKEGTQETALRSLLTQTSGVKVACRTITRLGNRHGGGLKPPASLKDERRWA